MAKAGKYDRAAAAKAQCTNLALAIIVSIRSAPYAERMEGLIPGEILDAI
jgi:hypothetical protein